jgi:hypothetical protein
VLENKKASHPRKKINRPDIYRTMEEAQPVLSTGNEEPEDNHRDDINRNAGDAAPVVAVDASRGAAIETAKNGKTAAGGGGEDKKAAPTIVADKTHHLIDGDDHDDNETYDLEQQVEAIDREEAALPPALQRNDGIASPPGAFRASPTRGLRRAGASSSVTSSLDDSTVSQGDLSHPIEAILVDTNSTVDQHPRYNYNNRYDDDDIINAEPLAPVNKQSGVVVPTAPRYILMGFAVIFMVLIIVVAAELIEIHQDNKNAGAGANATKYVPVTKYVSHHAVIFGSKSIGCVLGEGSNDGDDDDDDLTMGINISCAAPEAKLYLHRIGPNVTCYITGDTTSGISSDGSEDQFCNLPLSHVSYVSFDCETLDPVKDVDPTASVEVFKEPFPATAVASCVDGDGTAVDRPQTTTTYSVVAFLHLQRICSVDDDTMLWTMSPCDNDNAADVVATPNTTSISNYTYTPLFGECAKLMLDGQSAQLLAVEDKSHCPSKDDTEAQNATVLEPILIANVSTISEMFLW